MTDQTIDDERTAELLDVVAAHPRSSAREIADRTGIPRRDVFHLLDQAAEAGTVDREKPPLSLEWLWFIPGGVTSAS